VAWPAALPQMWASITIVAVRKVISRNARTRLMLENIRKT
jgi:hypothetical protein